MAHLENQGTRGNRCENEEIAGRNLWKNRMNAGKDLKKSHAIMEARQSFEKARNIEASIFKKPRVRSSTESSIRWGSEQDSLQFNSSVRWGSEPDGLQVDGG